MIQASLDEQTAAHVAELFGTLGDTSRVRILFALLDSEMNVGLLADIIGISPSAVSHHMRLLRQMHIVRSRKEGREVYYRMDDEHIADLFQRGLDHILHG